MLLMFLDRNGWSLCCCQRFLKTTSAYLSQKRVSSFKAFKEKTWKISDLCYTHTCQDDTISCGVYVCYFVKKLIKSQKELLSNRIFANEYRNFIKNILIN